MFSVDRRRYRPPIRMGRIADANRLFSYTVLFVLFISLLGISSLVNNYILRVFITQLTIITPTALYILSNKKQAKEYLYISRVKAVPVLASALLAVAILPFLSMINNLSSLFVKNVTDDKIHKAVENYPPVLLIFAVAFLPALAEEFLFRGVIFNSHKQAGVLKAAIYSGVLFGFMHGNLNQFAYALVAGFLFSMIDYSGGTVIYSIIIHFIINTFSIVGIYLKGIKSEFLGILFSDEAYGSVAEVFKNMLIPAVIGIIIAGFMYMLIKKFSDVKEVTCDERLGKEEGIFDSTLAVGVIIMLVNIIANEFI